MENFSQATATQADLQIALYLVPIGLPQVQIVIDNTVVFDDVMTSATYLEQRHDLLRPISIWIELRDKEYNLEHETAILVERFDINKIPLIPDMTQHFVYQNDRGWTSPTNYLGFNGIWRLNTVDCFYRWWHTQSGQGWLLLPST